MKRILAIVLTLAMLFSFSGIPVFADGETDGITTYAELVAALAEGGEIKLAADITTEAALVTSGVTATIDLNGNTLKIGAGDNKFNDATNLTIKNGDINIDGVVVNVNAIFCLDEYEETLVTTLTLDNVNVKGSNYSSAYGVFYIGDSSVLNVNGGEWNLSNDLFEAGGVFKADDAKATLNISNATMTLHNVRRVVTYAATTIDESTIAITGDADGVDAEMEHGFNRSPLTVTNSTITMENMVGRGITAECGAVSISENSTVTITNAQEATIDVRENQTVTVDNTSTVTVDAAPTITSGTITGVTVNVPPKGNVPYAYTSATTIWGETWSNATKSYVIKVLDADDNVMGTTTLNPELYNFAGMNGNVAPTWHISLDPSADTDTYWIQEWIIAPSIANQPAKVELWVDGVKVNEGSVQLNEADDKNKKCAAVTDANGKILSYVGITDNSYGSDFTAALQTAINAGGNIVMLRDVTLTETLTVPEDVTVTLDLNGKTLKGNVYVKTGATVEIKNGSIDNTNSDVSGVESIGTLTLTDVNIISARHAVRIEGGTAEINGGEYELYGTAGKTTHVVNVSGEGTTVTINGGTFVAPKGTEADSGAAVNVQAGSNVTILGGNFSNGLNNTLASKGTLTVKGGTFDQDPASYVAEDYKVAKNADGTYKVGVLPNAAVNNLGRITIDDYDIYTGSLVDGGDPIDLQVAMEFIAKDTAEEAAANAFGEYTTDFYITIAGAANGSFVADGCYLAGNYGTFGWIMIPLDGMTIENGKVYPVITSVGLDFSYVDICTSVKNFKCGIYFSDEVIEANPDMTVKLTLGLSENLEAAQAAEFITVDEPYTYNVADFKKVASVTDTEGNVTYYADIAEAIKAAQDGDTVTIFEGDYTDGLSVNKDITVVGETDAEGNNLVNISGKLSITADGASVKNINIYNKGDSAGYISAKDVLVEGCSVVGYNGFRYCYTSGNVTFKDSIITGDVYGIHFDGSTGGEIKIDNCVITGWTSFAGTITKVTITGTEFAKGNYNQLRFYQDAEIDDSTFNPDMNVDFGKDEVDVVITDSCVSDGSPLTDIIYLGDIANMGVKVTIDDNPVVVEASVTPEGGKTAYYLTLQEALDAAVSGTGNVTVEILRDIDLSNVDWNPVTVSAPGYPMVTVNGNEYTITGLNDMLFAGTWAGNSGLVINDLTIKDSKIEHDVDDTAGNIGVGAFIGYPQASATITLNNCHLVDSVVSGGHWTGGLIGMAGGYNGNDGPVFMNLTITGCSVTDSTITGKGSAGGVIGHGSCAAWTNVVIEDTTVSGNTITSTGTDTNKAGSVMGTIGAAGQETTADGETKTGGAFVSATVSGNTVTSGGTAITTIYGRQGTETGVLTLNGGTYDSYPIEENVSYAAPAEGYKIVENENGTYGIIAVAEDEELFKIAGTNMTLGNDLSLNFYFAKANVEGEDYYVTITKTYVDKENVVVNIPYSEWYDNDANYWRVSFDGIAAKEMCDDIYIQVFHGDGTAASEKATESVRSYTMRRLANSNTSKEEKTTLVDMLNYGAAAQGEFSYNVADLANSQLTDEQKALATTEVNCENIISGTSGKAAGSALSLVNNIVLQMWFTGVNTDMYAVVKYTDHYGVAQEYKVEGNEFVYSNGYYAVMVDTMVVADGYQPVTCTIYDSEGNEVANMTESISSYVARAMESGNTQYEPIIKFITSAKIYLHSK